MSTTFFLIKITPAPNVINAITPIVIGITKFKSSPVLGVTIISSALSDKSSKVSSGTYLPGANLSVLPPIFSMFVIPKSFSSDMSSVVVNIFDTSKAYFSVSVGATFVSFS